MKCIFCGDIENETPNRIWEFESGIAFTSRNQAYKGWSMLAFKKHVEDLRELSEEDISNFWSDIIKLANAVEKAFKPDKINYAILMNADPHLHCHVIPRYKNDPNWGRNPWPLQQNIVDEDEQSRIAEKIRNFL